jgi:hypothetical protein
MTDPNGYARYGAEEPAPAPAVTFTPYPVAATCPATGAEYGTAE